MIWLNSSSFISHDPSPLFAFLSALFLWQMKPLTLIILFFLKSFHSFSTLFLNQWLWNPFLKWSFPAFINHLYLYYCTVWPLQSSQILRPCDERKLRCLNLSYEYFIKNSVRSLIRWPKLTCMIKKRRIQCYKEMQGHIRKDSLLTYHRNGPSILSVWIFIYQDPTTHLNLLSSVCIVSNGPHVSVK